MSSRALPSRRAPPSRRQELLHLRAAHEAAALLDPFGVARPPGLVELDLERATGAPARARAAGRHRRRLEVGLLGQPAAAVQRAARGAQVLARAAVPGVVRDPGLLAERPRE